MPKPTAASQIIRAQVAELREMMFVGNKEGVDNWFEKHSFNKNKKLRLGLLLELSIGYGFFSFRSLSNKKAELDKEALWRHLAILKHYPFKDQLTLLMTVSQQDELFLEHINILNFSSSSKRDEKALAHNDTQNLLGLVVCNLFNKEKFTLIEALKNILKIEPLTISISTAPIYKEEPNMRGCFYVSGRSNFFSPLDSIIYNYSSAKYDFLLSQGLSLPTNKKARALNDELVENMRLGFHINNSHYFGLVEEKLNNYLAMHDKELLNSTLSPILSIETKLVNKV